MEPVAKGGSSAGAAWQQAPGAGLALPAGCCTSHPRPPALLLFAPPREFNERYKIDVKSNPRACHRLRMGCEKVRRGQRAISFQHQIFNDCTGRLIADAQVTVVFLEQATGRVVTIDKRFTELWPELLELPAE